jgi:hypothetical protein
MRNVSIAKYPLLLVALGLASCVVLTLAVPKLAQSKDAPNTQGALWRSWSAEGRERYVDGYLLGFQRGKRVACSFYEEKTGVSSPVPVEKLPTQVCLKSLPEFTEPYYQAYVDRITEYYTKYPNDSAVGISEVLTNLAAPPGLSVEQIHEKLRGSPK